jgi:signal transduction histidine kinase
VTSVFGGRLDRRSLRRSRRFGVFVLVFALILVLVNLGGWRVRASMRDTLDDELGKRLVAISVAAADRIDPGYVEALAAPDGAAGLEGLVVGDQLRRLRDALRLAGVALLDADGRVLLDVDDAVPPGAVHPVAALHASAIAAARTGFPTTTDLYESGGGVYYKNGYAPVMGPEGEVRAVVLVEAGADFFDALEGVSRVILVTNAASALAIVVLSGILFQVLRTEARLDETLRRTETLSLMGEMAASVAHEIKNPLGIIRATAERLRRRHGTGEEIFEYIPEEVDRLDAILTAYLDFARGGGAVERSGGSTFVAEAADAVLRLTRHDLESQGIGVNVEIPPTLSVAVEGSALRQVLLNLILNARQAMEVGGTLAIVAANEGDEIRLEVTDTGKGIAPEDHRRIFEPFYSGREQGSGLGLAITRRVVEAAGGRIEVASELRVGTTFTITLPGSGEGGAG